MNLKNNRQRRIKELIERELQSRQIEIKDNSHLHATHGNIKEGETETHLFIKIRSHKFKSLSKVEMHRLVYKILDEEFLKGLHAIELDLDN